VVTLVFAAALSAPAFSQEPEAASADDVAATADEQPTEVAPESDPAGAAAVPDLPPPGTPDSSTVETILRQQEELLRGQRFNYDPEGRRDPFQSLFESVKRIPKGERPRGVAGMLVSEVNLDGIIQDPQSGDIAFFMGSDNKGYFLRVGDTVYDGQLVAIDARRGTVTFRQQVDDPRMIKPYRDVVKRLEAVNEESSNE
jgi:hypothetical protein